jgi:hypothetical protein
MSRGRGATGGVVRRSQLRRPPLTAAQTTVLLALRRMGPATPEQLCAGVAIPDRRAWLALAGLVDRGDVRREGELVRVAR